MKKVIKWLGLIVGVMVLLIILAGIIVPLIFDIEGYKPRIEHEITKATGRPFTIGGDLKLSLFPWAGLAFSDLHMGNPDGFTEKDFVSIKSFDVKVKFLPLISRDIQVKRFVVVGPKIMLEKTKGGTANWEGLSKRDSADTSVEEQEEAGEVSQDALGNLPIKQLSVAEFAVREGELLYIDHASDTRKEIKDLNIELKDVSLQQPVKLFISANAEGKALSIEGEVGPIGKEPGKGKMMVDLAVRAMDMLSMHIEGSVTDLASRPQFDLGMSTDTFSPMDLKNALVPDFGLKTRDPEALKAMSVDVNIKGTTQNIQVSDAVIELDQSRMTFSATAKDLSKPDVTFRMDLDKIDADRYLPPAEEKKEEKKPGRQTKTDYGPLRKMVLDSVINIGELTIKGVQIKDIKIVVKGKNGVFNLDPVSLKAYEGNVEGVADLDFKGEVPATNTKMEVKGVQVRGIVSDFMKKDFLEGETTASVNLSMSGSKAAQIKRTLAGKGKLVFINGAIVGIDLSGMVNNIKSAFGMAQSGEDTSRTDFSELIVPFEIEKGVVNTQNASLVSPGLRVLAKGKADLSNETIDFRIEPTFVKTLKGQGDTEERSGVTVPVKVSGSFSKPRFSPDLDGMVKKSVEKGVEELIKRATGEKDEKAESTEDTVKGLLKDILGR
jgi:AsmA protein